MLPSRKGDWSTCQLPIRKVQRIFRSTMKSDRQTRICEARDFRRCSTRSGPDWILKATKEFWALECNKPNKFWSWLLFYYEIFLSHIFTISVLGSHCLRCIELLNYTECHLRKASSCIFSQFEHRPDLLAHPGWAFCAASTAFRISFLFDCPTNEITFPDEFLTDLQYIPSGRFWPPP